MKKSSIAKELLSKYSFGCSHVTLPLGVFESCFGLCVVRNTIYCADYKSDALHILNENFKYINTVKLPFSPYNMALYCDSLFITSPKDKTIYKCALDLPTDVTLKIEDAYPNNKLIKPIFMEVNHHAVCIRDGDDIRILMVNHGLIL